MVIVNQRLDQSNLGLNQFRYTVYTLAYVALIQFLTQCYAFTVVGEWPKEDTALFPIEAIIYLVPLYKGEVGKFPEQSMW